MNSVELRKKRMTALLNQVKTRMGFDLIQYSDPALSTNPLPAFNPTATQL